MQDMKFICSNLCLGGLSTDDTNDDVSKDDDNDKTQRTIHYYIGYLAFVPNELKAYSNTNYVLPFDLDVLMPVKRFNWKFF